MATRVFLIRHGVTTWHEDDRLVGQRDVPLSQAGVAQSEKAAAALAEISVADVIASPLQRAMQSAEIITASHGIQVARDPRLTDFRVGEWSGMTFAELEKRSDYQRFLDTGEAMDGGEGLDEITERATAAIEQAVEDSPSGDDIAVVTHAGIIRVLLSSYLGATSGKWHQLRVSPGSISVLSFVSSADSPRVLAINHCSSLAEVL